MKKEKLIIIGSGPAAYTAAIYAARAHLEPLLIEGKEPGGQLMGTTYVENWPGIKRILGPQLINDMKEHAQSLGTRFIAEEALEVSVERPFQIKTHRNNLFYAEALIIATGATPKRLGCPGESDYWGKGVTTCAVCDGVFYHNKKVIIVGGGDSAMENASFLTNFTQDITIVHILDKFTACPSMQERVLSNPSIKVIYSSTVSRIMGDGSHVTGVILTDQKTKKETEVPIDGVFISIGLNPNTGIVKGKVALNEYGYIKHILYSQTSVSGIFAAGDVVDDRYRQAITSAGSGCMAALDAERFLKENP
ncbi:MAG: thioredoxin-disulfide reductase [Candidatus Babeliaceae bacterium]